MKNLNVCSSFHYLIMVLSILAAGGAFAQPAHKSGRPAPTVLTLAEYLTQVTGKHLGYRASDQTAKAARLYADEGTLLTKPNLIGSASSTVDGRAYPLTSDRVRVQTYSLGIGQQTSFGLSGKLSYGQFALEIPNGATYSSTFPQIELSQSLMRNWAGAEVRAQVEFAQASALAKAFSQSYLTKTTLLEAESFYWRLALAREMVTVQKDALERAQRIQEWTSRRVRLQLADRAEALQASTNLQARKLELRSAQDAERSAAQTFNSSRGVLSGEVNETLVDLTPDLTDKLKAPERALKRDDIVASEYQAKAAQANANLARERNKPTLEVFGSTALGDPAAPPTALTTLVPSTARPATTIGIRLVAPLDLSTTSKARQGYAAEAQAAEWQLQRKILDEERDWQDLASRFQESKERLKLYADLEKTQKEKLDYERDRQQRGRSTLQQVLLFESDYESAQLGRIRTLADLLTLNAQMKLYGVSYESR